MPSAPVIVPASCRVQPVYDQTGGIGRRIAFGVKDQFFNLIILQELLVEKIIEKWSENAEQ